MFMQMWKPTISSPRYSADHTTPRRFLGLPMEFVLTIDIILFGELPHQQNKIVGRILDVAHNT